MENGDNKYRPKTRDIPPNDMHNFFFRSGLCGKFENRGFREQPNYSNQEVAQMLGIIGKRFNISGYFLCYVVPITTLIILVILLGFGIEINKNKYLWANFIFVISGVIFYVQLTRQRKRKLQKFLDLQNQVLLSKSVMWKIGHKQAYLHLCTDYPMNDNPRGGGPKGAWDQKAQRSMDQQRRQYSYPSPRNNVLDIDFKDRDEEEMQQMGINADKKFEEKILKKARQNQKKRGSRRERMRRPQQ